MHSSSPNLGRPLLSRLLPRVRREALPRQLGDFSSRAGNLLATARQRPQPRRRSCRSWPARPAFFRRRRCQSKAEAPPPPAGAPPVPLAPQRGLLPIALELLRHCPSCPSAAHHPSPSGSTRAARRPRARPAARRSQIGSGVGAPAASNLLPASSRRPGHPAV